MKKFMLLAVLMMAQNVTANEVCRGTLPTGDEIVVNMEKDYAFNAYDFEFSIEGQESVLISEVKFEKNLEEISQDDKDVLLDNIDIIKIDAEKVHAVAGFRKLSPGNGFYGFDKWIDKDGNVLATTATAGFGMALCE